MNAFGSQIRFAWILRQNPQTADFGLTVEQMVRDAIVEYKEMRVQDSHAHFRFLPSPDLNKHGKNVWMLPNLTSLTNIYARINRFCKRRLDGVCIVHDQQLELDEILRGAKQSAEAMKESGAVPHVPFADYNFSESASLEFAHSHESIGIQVADVLSGTAMRYYRSLHAGATANPPAEIARAMKALRDSGDPRTGHGLNQVVPTRMAF
jgi:hypothetical protein